MSLLRRRLNRSAGDEADVNMTPMLDIVFIMLIFFIVTATFLDETALDFTQPPPSVETPINPPPAIQVYLDETNRISVDQQVTELSAVPAKVETLLAKKPEAVVMLTASAQASWDPVVFIKDEMQKAGRPVQITVTR